MGLIKKSPSRLRAGWGFRGSGTGRCRGISLCCFRLSFQMMLACDDAELVHDSHIELTNAFLGDAELLADFLQRHTLGVIEAGSHADDLTLARIEIIQQPIDTAGV